MFEIDNKYNELYKSIIRELDSSAYVLPTQSNIGKYLPNELKQDITINCISTFHNNQISSVQIICDYLKMNFIVDKTLENNNFSYTSDFIKRRQISCLASMIIEMIIHIKYYNNIILHKYEKKYDIYDFSIYNFLEGYFYVNRYNYTDSEILTMDTVNLDKIKIIDIYT